jgi:para-aminobenzoate synthetase component 1
MKSNFSKKEYCRAVEKVRDYIAAGDIYQANLSQRFSVGFEGSAWSLYKKLRRINPAPFAAFLNFPEVKVLSDSPERFLKITGRNVETRPMKGTRPRGRDKIEDWKLKTELENSVKDRAENLMIVDLERNDLGKVCEYGSVKVSELEVVETYPTVFQMVSTVNGKLKTNVSQIGCLKACFPGGSITGAPKVRAMEIIDELEPTRRNIYTGAIGYLGFDGEMDLNIAIRTIIVKDNKAFFQVGGGVVIDSKPELEYQETLDKAKALMKALGK